MRQTKKKVFYKESPLRFQCSGCGQCCHGVPGQHYIRVSDTEVIKIRDHYGLSRDWFRRRYLESLDGGGTGIRLNSTGACPFLGEQNRCAIYALRPAQCRTYPFWPEIVGSKTAWREEARRCEGIDRGAVVPVKAIEEKLVELGE